MVSSHKAASVRDRATLHPLYRFVVELVGQCPDTKDFREQMSCSIIPAMIYRMQKGDPTSGGLGNKALAESFEALCQEFVNVLTSCL